jgi:hypothetical protein
LAFLILFEYSSVETNLPPFGSLTFISSFGFKTIFIALKIVLPISNSKIKPGKPYSPFEPKFTGIFGVYQAITLPLLLVALKTV